MTLMDEETGYRPCACRDCMETTIGHQGALCLECRAAGCQPDSECCAPGSYGGLGDTADEDFGEGAGI